MVDALEKARGLLKPGGAIIDAHDRPIPPRVAVISGGRSADAGHLADRSDFESVRRTDEAVAYVVAKGLLAVEDEDHFEHSGYAHSLDDVAEWLTDRGGTSYVPQATVSRVEALLAGAGQDAQIVVHRAARMTKLRLHWPAGLRAAGKPDRS